MLTVMHYEEGFITYVIDAFSPPREDYTERR